MQSSGGTTIIKQISRALNNEDFEKIEAEMKKEIKANNVFERSEVTREQAIARIDAGDYGYCDETGEAIGVGRLLARPTASLSLEAQQRRELKQKMFGD